MKESSNEFVNTFDHIFFKKFVKVISRQFLYWKSMAALQPTDYDSSVEGQGHICDT